MRKPRIGRNGQDPIGAGRAQPRCSLSLSHKHEVFSITAADTALDVAAHTLARCRVRLGPPRRALPPNAKLEHSWLLSSIFNCPDILNAVLTRTAPVPKGHLAGLERPGHCTATVLGVQPHAKSKHPRPVDGSCKDSIFLQSPNSAPSASLTFVSR